jgi:glutamyl-tRNA synthetase
LGFEEFKEKIKETAYRYALENAVKHGGKAQPGPVVNKVLGEFPDLRSRAREIAQVVSEIVNKVNSMSLDEQKRVLDELFGGVRERVVEEKKLPPLPNVKNNYVVTRFAPNPDFVLHLGNARPALLSYVYAHEIYNGKMILRFEDTDPRTKKPLPEAYNIIKEDLRWLGIKWDEEYIQSLRLEIYYDIAKKLLEKGGGYIDLLSQEEFRKLKLERKPSPYRNNDPQKNLELFDKMLSGYFGEGEAVFRVKTDLNYPDPSVIDWIAFRIIDTDKYPHPIVGSKYIVWPTYNFAAGVDDYLMGVTHIFRGREHYQNTIKQSFLYSHMNWEYPVVISHGRLKLEGFILSKSKIKSLLEKNPEKFRGYADPRFGTLSSLRERGVLPEVIREIVLETGIKPSDAVISWDLIASQNRKKIDPVTKRIIFVEDPVKLYLKDLDKEECVNVSYHPDNSSLGSRKLCVDKDSRGYFVYVQRRDILENRRFRLMEFANIEIISESKDFYEGRIISRDLSLAKELKLQIIQWIGKGRLDAVLSIPEGFRIIRKTGYVEEGILSLRDKIFQLIRVGFAKLDKISEKRVYLLYMHK